MKLPPLEQVLKPFVSHKMVAAATTNGVVVPLGPQMQPHILLIVCIEAVQVASQGGHRREIRGQDGGARVWEKIL